MEAEKKEGSKGEESKSRKRRSRVRGAVKAADHGDELGLAACETESCAKSNVKSVWVVGVAVIVLVSIFCFAMVSNTGKPVTQAAQVAAQPVAMTFPQGYMPYQMDPIAQWGMQAMQPAAYGPNCAIYPQSGAQGNYYGNSPNAAPYYPQATAAQSVAMVQQVQQAGMQAPPIFRDAVMKHEYRGVCENCHKVF